MGGHERFSMRFQTGCDEIFRCDVIQLYIHSRREPMVDSSAPRCPGSL